MPAIGFKKRKTGISLVGDLFWGAHFCFFFQSRKDLLDILIPYFCAGLVNNEFCVWVTDTALTAGDAKKALQKALPDFEKYKRQLEIISYKNWPTTKAASERIIAAKSNRSFSGGFDGLRLAHSGPANANVAEAIGKYNAIAAFGYRREKFNTPQLMEIVKRHYFALVRNAGKWEIIEAAHARAVKHVLKVNEEKLRSVFSNMSEGFGYIRIVLDKAGKPVDFIFLEVNPAFEKLTGLKAKNVIGKKITTVLPGIKKDPAGWISRFGKVALSGKPARFESYAVPLKRWYEVSAFGPYRGYCAVIFSDVTALKQSREQLYSANEKLAATNEELSSLNEELSASNEEFSAANEELRAETEQRQKTEETLKKSERRNIILAEAASTLLAADDPQLMVNEVAIKVMNFLDCQVFFNYLAAPQNYRLQLNTYAGISIRQAKDIEWLEYATTVCGCVARDRKMVLAENIQKSSDPRTALVRSFGVRAYCCHPLLAGKYLIGTLSFGTTLRDTFSEDEIFLMKEAADLVAIAIRRKLNMDALKESRQALEEARNRLETEVEKRTEELTRTNRRLIKEIVEKREAEKQIRTRNTVLKIMARASSRKQYLDFLVKYIKGLIGCRYAGMRVLNEEGQIPYESYIGFSREFWEKENWISVKRDQCACIRVVTGQPLPQDEPCMTSAGSFVTNDSSGFVNSLSEKEKCAFRGVCVENGFSSIAIVPIRYRHKAIAAIHLADERKEILTLQNIELLEKLCSLIAEAIYKFDIEDRVRQASQQVINILENLSEGFFTLDNQWRFTYVNSAAERILGVRRENLLGKVEWDVFPETKNTRIYEEYQNCMAHKIPASFEVLSPRANKWMEVHAYPSGDGLSVYFRDISEKRLGQEKLKEAQDQIERARRLSDIGTLAATVAHELRNPLAAIRMAAYNIKRKAQAPELEKHLLNIDKKISESDQIINNLLFYSRLKQPHFEEVDLYKIMEECLEIAGRHAAKNEATVKKKYRLLRRVSVKADALQMKELFANIVNNAYDAMHDRSGTIEITATREDESLKIAIKDSGCGMDAEQLKRASEPFFTTKTKGTGLGLTVCFQVMDLHAGKIELSSEKNKGTTVTITFPLKEG